MQWFIRLLSIVLVINGSLQISTPEGPSYIAAVVEFNPKSSANSALEIFNDHTKQYVELIETVSTDFDIIVFSEDTLNDQSTAVNYPNTKSQPVPCNNEEFNENVQQISCAAKRSKRYVVINLTTKTNCSIEKEETKDPRECAQNGWNLYNTNIVFDRNGTIISTYRKFNLFVEPGINTTLLPEESNFTTDFGVTFGHVVCFDLIFKTPAIELVNKGIQNIILPTMWFSELPFGTAVQIQQSWAQTFNVNLLAAGASTPSKGSTGSGIYSGKRGALISRMNAEADTILLIAIVPKVPGSLLAKTQTKLINGNKESTTEPSNEIPIWDDVYPLTVTQDTNLINYKVKPINTSSNEEQKTEVCHDDFCCDFEIKLMSIIYNPVIPANRTVAYSYVAAAYNGIRTYPGVPQKSYISTCAVFACTNSSNIKTCGTQYPVGTSVLNRFKFDKLLIKGRFHTERIFHMPNTVNTLIMPLNPSEYNYTEENSSDKVSYRSVAMNLLNPRHDLLTFAIYGSDFTVASDGNAASSYTSLILLIASAIYNLL